MRFKLLKSAAAVALGAAIASTSMAELPPQVGTATDSAHVFLNFSAGKSVAENTQTAINYMAAIDPGQYKVNFVTWLVNAGFISDPSQWKAQGQQRYTSVPGDYGPGVINAFAHIIILNAADLGFIRNQYIRCKPDCKTPGAKIYTYLENYGGQQFAQVDPNDGHGVAGTQQTNNAAAVSIAFERRTANNLQGPAGAGGRIADVAFEWAPASNGSSPTTNFGQLYGYIVLPQLTNIPTTCATPSVGVGTFSPTAGVDEQYVWPSNGGTNQAFWDCKFNDRTFPTSLTANNADLTRIGYLNPPPDPGHRVNSLDPFAPELDALGVKPMPGLCLICHGGNIPSNLASTGNWGATGQINEFRFLPADADNSIFGCDDRPTGPCGPGPLVAGAAPSDLTQAGQQIELKKYNQAVALTFGALPPKNAVFLPDGTIGGGQWRVGTSPNHALQVLFGWYNNGNDADYSMPGMVQNGGFTPVAWRTTQKDIDLYQKVLKFSCRSCHLTREPSLDFHSAAQFKLEKGNIQDYVFQPECDYFKLHHVKPTNIVMPLAKITWERFWNGFDPVSKNTLPIKDANGNVLIPTSLKTDPNSQVNLMKAYFGYTPTSYCDAQH